MFGLDDVHPFHQMLIAITLGLFVGLQRQWADSPLGGVRTFSLISLLGALAGFLTPTLGAWPLVVGGFGTIGFIVIGNAYHVTTAQREKKFGLSTEVAMLVMFLIGALVVLMPVGIAVTAAGALAIVLQLKIELHELANRFEASELKSIMQFVLMALIILPLIPNKTIDPLHVINPYQIFLMVILIVGIGLAGYIVYKFFGQKAGTILSGILGGMISSTATTLNYARAASRHEQSLPTSAAIVIIAWSIVYIRLGLEIATIAPSFTEAFLPLAAMFFVSAGSAIWLWAKAHNGQEKMPIQTNPSEFKVAFVFGLVYGVILFAAAYAKEHWGEAGLYTIAFFSGITDMDAITLSTASLVDVKKIAAGQGWRIIIIAASANTFFKGLITYFVGGKPLFLRVLLPMVATISVGLIMLFFLPT